MILFGRWWRLAGTITDWNVSGENMMAFLARSADDLPALMRLIHLTFASVFLPGLIPPVRIRQGSYLADSS